MATERLPYVSCEYRKVPEFVLSPRFLAFATFAAVDYGQCSLVPFQMTNSWRVLARMARDRIVATDPGEVALLLNVSDPSSAATSYSSTNMPSAMVCSSVVFGPSAALRTNKPRDGQPFLGHRPTASARSPSIHITIYSAVYYRLPCHLLHQQYFHLVISVSFLPEPPANPAAPQHTHPG